MGTVVLGLAVVMIEGRDPAVGQPPTVRNGEIGFVVSSIHDATVDPATKLEQACPEGLNLHPLETAQQIAARGLPSPTALAEARYLESPASAAPGGGGGRPSAEKSGVPGPGLTNAVGYGAAVCLNPRLTKPDPLFKTVKGDVRVEGLNLDGENTRLGGKAPAKGCAQQNFRGVDDGLSDAAGVDNQRYRVYGCIRGSQQEKESAGLQSEMIEGTWTLVFKLSGVDSLTNDDSVQIFMASSGDPLQLTSAGATRNWTYAYHPNTRYQARTTGRIVNGVLMTDPVDFTFTMRFFRDYIDNVLKGARFKIQLSEDGASKGILAGYSDVETFYHNFVLVGGGAFVSGASAGANNYTCNGVYHALQQLADGYKDPASGRCTALSTQYTVTAVPAFIVAPAPGATAPGAKTPPPTVQSISSGSITGSR